MFLTLFFYGSVALVLYIVVQCIRDRNKKIDHLPSFSLEEPSEIPQIREAFENLADQPKNANYEQSAQVTSKIISSGEFLNVDHLIRKNAQRLFWIHR